MVASYELHEEPDLESPVLVLSLEGWIDAWLASDFPFVTESLVKKPVVL